MTTTTIPHSAHCIPHDGVLAYALTPIEPGDSDPLTYEPGANPMDWILQVRYAQSESGDNRVSVALIDMGSLQAELDDMSVLKAVIRLLKHGTAEVEWAQGRVRLAQGSVQLAR